MIATVGRLDKMQESGEIEALIRSGSRFCAGGTDELSIAEDDLELSSHQAGRLLEVSPSTVVSWINQGKLAAHRTPGGHRRIKVSDLRQFLRESDRPIPPLLRPPEPEPRRIFVVDDELAVIRAIQRAFEQHGGPYVVDGCEDGIEALVRIGAEEPDLVLLDIYMAGIDGFEVCRRLRRIPQLESTQIVAITAHPSEEARARILDHGAIDYWVKPVRVEQVIAVLEAGAAAGKARTEEAVGATG